MQLHERLIAKYFKATIVLTIRGEAKQLKLSRSKLSYLHVWLVVLQTYN